MDCRCWNTGRAFSLIEAMVVVVLVGILAASAAPMLGSQGELRERAVAAEISATLQTARAFAMATGDPHGVRVRVEEGTIGLVIWSTETRSIAAMRDLAGEQSPEYGLAEHVSGVEIGRVSDGQRDARDVTIWFGHDGATQWRRADGALIGPADRVAEIELKRGTTVRVLAVSGAIE